MTFRSRWFVFVSMCASGLGAQGLAWAQAGPPAPAPAAGTVTVVPGPTQTTTTQSTMSYGGLGYGNPQSPNGTIGGGNATESSAHPVTGDQEDRFDLGRGGGGEPGGVAHGGENGPVFLGQPTYAVGETPASYVVRKGDTLWTLCDHYFQNPYEWPRVWSYNPQIKNPHWIYPGDEIRLKEGGGGADSAGAGKGQGGGPGGAGTSLIDRRRQVP
ncbi:MAG TPA: LysM peptidoglycan-binding domain-containing protein, partial [Polyangiaceae bacterium]|nr:LysM peptidoglycan-binding domain-containing protein [Polyangiaceae bacterium]